MWKRFVGQLGFSINTDNENFVSDGAILDLTDWLIYLIVLHIYWMVKNEWKVTWQDPKGYMTRHQRLHDKTTKVTWQDTKGYMTRPQRWHDKTTKVTWQDNKGDMTRHQRLHDKTPKNILLDVSVSPKNKFLKRYNKHLFLIRLV